MECNRDEALRSMEIAERKFKEYDIVGAKKFALKAKTLFSALDGIDQMISTFDVYLAAEKKFCGDNDWYHILQVHPSADEETIKRQYKKLALQFHPDKNNAVGADGAFRIISDAWSVLSDKSRKMAYDQLTNSQRNDQNTFQANRFGAFSGNISTTVGMRYQEASSRPPTAAPSSHPSKPHTFWTYCSSCSTYFEYTRAHLNHHLKCPKCEIFFIAVPTTVPQMSAPAIPNRGVPGSQKGVANGMSDNPILQQHEFFGTSANDQAAMHTVQQAHDQKARSEQNAKANAARREEGKLQKINALKRRAGAAGSSTTATNESEIAKRMKHIDDTTKVVSGSRSSGPRDASGLTAQPGKTRPNTNARASSGGAGRGSLGKMFSQKNIRRMLIEKMKLKFRDELEEFKRKDVEKEDKARRSKAVEVQGREKMMSGKKVDLEGKGNVRSSEKTDVEKEDKAQRSKAFDVQAREKIMSSKKADLEGKGNVRSSEKTDVEEDKKYLLDVKEEEQSTKTVELEQKEKAPSSKTVHSEEKKEQSSKEVDLEEKDKARKWRLPDSEKTLKVYKKRNRKVHKKETEHKAVDGNYAKKQISDDAGGCPNPAPPCNDSSNGADNEMSVPDADFYKFGDHSESSFKSDQIWAVYDEEDGMPRYYALIKKVLSLNPFKIRIFYLKAKSNDEFGNPNWTSSGYSKTCGDFRVGKFEDTDQLNVFSHVITWERGPNGVITIFPKKGDVWALYQNWSPDWDEFTPDDVIYKYEMVEVLDGYKPDEGIPVRPLVKVAGFTAVFQRLLDPQKIKRIPRKEMFRFSHQVPFHVLTGEEAQNSPKGCYELDPASTPKELLEVVREPAKAGQACQ